MAANRSDPNVLAAKVYGPCGSKFQLIWQDALLLEAWQTVDFFFFYYSKLKERIVQYKMQLQTTKKE